MGGRWWGGRPLADKSIKLTNKGGAGGWSGAGGDRQTVWCCSVFSSQSTKNNCCQMSIIPNNDAKTGLCFNQIGGFSQTMQALRQHPRKKAALTFSCRQLQFALELITWPAGIKQADVALMHLPRLWYKAAHLFLPSMQPVQSQAVALC